MTRNRNTNPTARPTPGPWTLGSDFLIVTDDDWRNSIAIVYTKESAADGPLDYAAARANAALIVAAVNACHALNPTDPLAAAEGLGTLMRRVERIAGEATECEMDEGPSSVDGIAWADVLSLRSTLRAVTGEE